jgi:hypothetical protein
MIKRIILCGVFSFLVACLLTTVGVIGAFSHLAYILAPGSLLCRRFLGSRFTGDVEGDMITPVIWLNLSAYTLLIFPVLMDSHTWIRRTEDAKL